MASDQSFYYNLVKTTLIILNSLVIIGLGLFVFLMVSRDLTVSIIIFIIGINFMASIVGVISESRLIVIITGFVTLLLIALAVFNRKEKTHNLTYSLLYFMAIVMLSFAFSAMLKNRNQQSSNGGSLSSQQPNPNSCVLQTVVIYETEQQQFAQIFPEGFKDAPPPYFNCDNPPPTYEEAVGIQI